MPRFEKTPLHVVSAVLILLGVYSLGGLGYALWVHSRESVVIWVVIGVLAFAGSAIHQRFVSNRRRRTSSPVLDRSIES